MCSVEFPDSFPIFLVIRRREIEIDSAKRSIGFSLAKDNRDLLIESNSMPEIGTSVLVGLNRLFHQRYEGGFAFLRCFIEANDVLLERLKRFSNFRLKGFNRHGGDSYFPRVKTQALQKVSAAIRS